MDSMSINTDYYGLLWTTMDYHGLPGLLWTTMDYYVHKYGLLWTTMDYPGLLWTTMSINTSKHALGVCPSKINN